MSIIWRLTNAKTSAISLIYLATLLFISLLSAAVFSALSIPFVIEDQLLPATMHANNPYNWPTPNLSAYSLIPSWLAFKILAKIGSSLSGIRYSIVYITRDQEEQFLPSRLNFCVQEHCQDVDRNERTHT